MANRLAAETSPYLRQHMDNPVDWYPWGSEAFEQARLEDKPLLLSVGYSACHWCHVMAHESFEDPETARLMNDNFVNVKVDREERPDIDSVYMNAVQAMTGSGGWPMTVVLTPAGEPFFGGTYFPPEDRFGRPSFRKVLEALASAWRERRDEVLGSAGEMRNYLGRLSNVGNGSDQLDPGLPRDALEQLHRNFDSVNGGFGTAPKFPPHAVLRFLLARPGDHAREMAHFTLQSMARGGIYDQAGGGFARYSVDERWLVPHFEKMLYDNAQLLSRYSEAYRLNAHPLYEEVIEGTVQWLLRELQGPGGAFYSALDADSEGEEGRFYVWEADDFDRVIGDDAPLAREWFSVSAAGNFEGQNILTAPTDPEAFASDHGVHPDDLEERVKGWRESLLKSREARVRPGLDDKVITSWNGLAIAGLADAGRVLHRAEYIERAKEAAAFLRSRVWQEGRLRHIHAAGESRVEGLLEDYAFLGLGLLSLYHASFEEEWLLWALDLCETMVEHFADEAAGGFFGTADDAEALIVRPKSVSDSALPADNAAAAELALHVARLTGDKRLEDLAARAVRGLADVARRHPSGMGGTLNVVEFLLHPPREIGVIGDRQDEATWALLRIVQQQPLPYAVAAYADGPSHPLSQRLPFLKGRGEVEGRPAAYVCEAGACRLPVTEPGALARALVEQAA